MYKTAYESQDRAVQDLTGEMSFHMQDDSRKIVVDKKGKILPPLVMFRWYMTLAEFCQKYSIEFFTILQVRHTSMEHRMRAYQ